MSPGWRRLFGFIPLPAHCLCQEIYPVDGWARRGPATRQVLACVHHQSNSRALQGRNQGPRRANYISLFIRKLTDTGPDSDNGRDSCSYMSRYAFRRTTLKYIIILSGYDCIRVYTPPAPGDTAQGESENGLSPFSFASAWPEHGAFS